MTNAFNRASLPPVINPFWLMVWAVAIDDDRQGRERKRREWLDFIAA